MSIKTSSLTVGIFFGLGTLVLASPSQAALINFGSWNLVGDVATPSLGRADLSSNALQNDDSPNPDSDFNFSTIPAVDSPTLESSLGLPPQSLDPDPLNFIFAFEGSGLQQEYTFTEETTFSFNWTFLTNDQTRNISGFDFDDYAFIALDDQILTLASTNSSVSTLIPSPGTNYSREVSGTYTQTFSPGTYRIALGVVDVGSFDSTSALQINNGQLQLPSQQVPESNSWLGLLVPLGFLSTRFLRQRQK